MPDDNQKIKYILKKYKKSKTLRIKINKYGEIIVTAPKSLNNSYIDNFVQSKSLWILDKTKNLLSLPKPNIKLKKEAFKKYKKQAEDFVLKKIYEINKFYKFKYNKIFIKDQKTRWGSCSSKKNLNFNYKILFLPDKFSDYIVTHELCHLKEMNHGPKFWQLIAQTIPDYQKIQNDLINFNINKNA